MTITANRFLVTRIIRIPPRAVGFLLYIILCASCALINTMSESQTTQKSTKDNSVPFDQLGMLERDFADRACRHQGPSDADAPFANLGTRTYKVNVVALGYSGSEFGGAANYEVLEAPTGTLGGGKWNLFGHRNLTKWIYFPLSSSERIANSAIGRKDRSVLCPVDIVEKPAAKTEKSTNKNAAANKPKKSS